MTLTLTREENREDGVFSTLRDENKEVIAHCLEHSYNCKPKLYAGEFICKRGMHRLEHMTKDFETFEVTNVTGHTDILFHIGNWNDDSKGCILLGEGIAQSSKGQMITRSKEAFLNFLQLLTGVDEFTLIVQD